MEPQTQSAVQTVDAKSTQVNILIVDDEPANLLALEAILEGPDQSLVKAQSGKEALRQLINLDFAVILLDVSMPDMDGFETARLIRQRDKTRLTPIIFLTAVGRTEMEIFRGYEVGGVDYLLKPLVPEILKSKVMIFIELYNKRKQIEKLNEELKQNAKNLVSANQELRKENIGRQQAEADLKKLNSVLEEKVAERSAVAEEKAGELARSNSELQQFVRVASHDLKEPLRMISSYVQLLQHSCQDKLGEEVNEYIHFAVDGAHRIQRLIDDLLSYTRLGAESKSIQKVDMAKVFDEALFNLSIAMGENEAEITCDPLPVLQADHTHMVLLLQNLMGNALKFHGKAKPKVHLSAQKEKEHWLFSVTDNGIGIDPIYFEKIFVVFQRLHARDEYPGTGIGLALCKKIVDQHNGKIWVESKLGSGSIFYFTIPVKE